MESMELSEKLCEQSRQKKEGFPAIERAEWGVVTDPETKDKLLTLLAAERLLGPNDKRVKELQEYFTSKEKEIRAPRDAHNAESGRIDTALRKLTWPVIREYVQELSELKQKPKLSREILSTKYDGLRKRTLLSVQTNEAQIRKIHELVRKGIGRLESMSLSPISEIQNVFIETKAEITEINWHTIEKIEIDEVEFFRGSPPEGADRTYSGPLSGLPMPPPRIPEGQR
jgi:hypothetical protein